MKGNIFKLSGIKNLTVAGLKSGRFIDPHDCESLPTFCVKYANAEKMADELGSFDNGHRRIFAILSGRFIFGDFIEALIVKNNWHCEELTISTLSMSQDNIDSLENLLVGDYVKQLNIIVSHYYFANERSELMPYMYERLDIEDKFQLAVASVHTKICMIKTTCGKKITIHGSANMRSSDNIEQITIETMGDIFGFNHEIHHGIIERHKTINKPVRSSELWQAVLAEKEKAVEERNPQQQRKERQSAAAKAGV